MKVLSIRNNKVDCLDVKFISTTDYSIAKTVVWYPSTEQVGVHIGYIEWPVSFEVPIGYVRLI